MSSTTAPDGPQASSPERRRELGWRGLDPLVPLTGLVALVVYALQGFDGKMIRDIGVYSYGGQQVADGVPPYVAIVNRAGPLAHLVPGIGAWVAEHVGVDEVHGMRMLFALLSAATVAASYVLGRTLFGSRAAGLAGAAALLTLHDFVYFATYGPREKTTMLLLTTLALLAIAHRRWATAGVLISLATLTWQPVLFAVLPAAAVAVLLQRKRRIRSLVAIAVGGLVPLVVTAGAYAAIGRSRIFWDCFLFINLRYTKQTTPLEAPGPLWHGLLADYGWTLWLILLGLLLGLVWAVVAAVGSDRRDPLPAALIATGVFTLGNVLWALKAFNGPPDAFVTFPGVVVGVAGLAALLQRRVPGRVALGVVAAWVVAATALTVVYTVSHRADGLVAQRRAALAVKAVLPPHARWLSHDAPQPLVLAHERNLSRLQLFGSGLADYVEATWPGGVDGYVRWVAARHPAIVVVGNNKLLPPLKTLLRHSYRRVGHSPATTWYANTDLGHRTLTRLQDVLH